MPAHRDREVAVRPHARRGRDDVPQLLREAGLGAAREDPAVGRGRRRRGREVRGEAVRGRGAVAGGRGRREAAARRERRARVRGAGQGADGAEGLGVPRGGARAGDGAGGAGARGVEVDFEVFGGAFALLFEVVVERRAAFL